MTNENILKLRASDEDSFLKILLPLIKIIFKTFPREEVKDVDKIRLPREKLLESTLKDRMLAVDDFVGLQSYLQPFTQSGGGGAGASRTCCEVSGVDGHCSDKSKFFAFLSLQNCTTKSSFLWTLIQENKIMRKKMTLPREPGEGNHTQRS